MVAGWKWWKKRRETRQQFDRLLRNEDLVDRVVRGANSVGEYVAGYLRADEQPFAWLDVSLPVGGVSSPRVLITDKRILVFSTGSRSQPPRLVLGFLLEEVARATLENPWATGRRVEVRIELTTRAGPRELVLRPLLAEVAREVEQFLSTSATRREALIRGRMASPPSPASVARFLLFALSWVPPFVLPLPWWIEWIPAAAGMAHVARRRVRLRRKRRSRPDHPEPASSHPGVEVRS